MQTGPYSVWWATRNAAVVTMPGRIDHANRGRAHAALMRAVQSGAAVIIADLTKASFCSDTATEVLVSVHGFAAEAGAQLRVAAAAAATPLIGPGARAGPRLDCYPTLAAALAGPRTRGTVSGRTATGRRLRLIPGGAAGSRSREKGAPRLSAVLPGSQTPPLRPPSAPA